MLALGSTLPLVVARFDAVSVTLWYLFATVMALQLIADMTLSSIFPRMYSYARGGAERVGTHDRQHSEGLTRARSEDTNWSLVSRIFATTRTAYWYVGIAWFVGVCLLGAWAVAGVVESASEPHAAWAAYSLIVVGTTFRFYGNVYTSFLFGMDKIVAWRRAEAITWLAVAFAGLATLVAGGGILALTFVTQGLLCLNVVRNGRLARHTLALGGIDASSTRADRQIWAEVWPRAVRGGLGVTLHAGMLHLAAVAVARLESPAIAGGYLLAYNVVRAADQFAQVPFYTKLPALAACRVQGDLQRLRELAQRGMKATYWILSLGLIAAGVILPWLLEWLESSVRFVAPQVWAAMAAAVFVERYGANHIQLHMTTNHVVLHIANGLTGVLFVLFCAASYRSLGILAIPLSQLAANLSWFAWYGARRSYQSVDFGFWQFERATSFLPALLMLLYTGWVFGTT